VCVVTERACECVRAYVRACVRCLQCKVWHSPYLLRQLLVAFEECQAPLKSTEELTSEEVRLREAARWNRRTR